MKNPVDELYRQFVEFLQEEKMAIDSNYVLVAPQGFRLDMEKIRSTPEFESRKYKDQLSQIREVRLLSHLMTTSIVYEYDPNDTKYLTSLLVRLSDENLVAPTEESDYKKTLIWKNKPRFDSYLVFPLNLLGTIGLNSYQLATEEWAKEYNKYSSERLAKFTGVPKIYHFRIKWDNFPRLSSKHFDFSEPLNIKVGIKSQYPVKLTLYPKDPNNDKYTTLTYKYSKWEPTTIKFEFNKASVAYALIAAFLFVSKNKKPAVLSSKDVKNILDEYNIIVPKNKSLADVGRLQKSLREKINKETTKTPRKHLLQIFKKQGNFFRLETSFELEK